MSTQHYFARAPLKKKNKLSTTQDECDWCKAIQQSRTIMGFSQTVPQHWHSAKMKCGDTRLAMQDYSNIKLEDCWDALRIFFFFSLECLMGCGNRLVKPKLREGQELNGMLIHKVFRSKALYIRPSRTLTVSYSRNVLDLFHSPMTFTFRKR